jgi:hypothetical protein
VGGAEPGLGVKKRTEICPGAQVEPSQRLLQAQASARRIPRTHKLVLFVNSMATRRPQLHYPLYFFLAYSVCFPSDFGRKNYQRRSGWKESTSIVTSRELNIMGRILLISDNAVGEAVENTAQLAIKT